MNGPSIIVPLLHHWQTQFYRIRVDDKNGIIGYILHQDLVSQRTHQLDIGLQIRFDLLEFVFRFHIRCEGSRLDLFQ